MMAFANSVNVVVNIDDLKDIQSILRASVANHDRFYRVFKDYMKEAGGVKDSLASPATIIQRPLAA